MLLTVFGVPTAAAAHGLQIVKAFFAVMVGEFDFLSSATLEQLRSSWASVTQQHVLYHHELPAAEVVSFFRQAQAPMLVFVDDPIAVAEALQQERGLNDIQSARAASIHVSVLEEIWAAPDVMVINAGFNRTLSLNEFVRSLAAFLSLPCSDHQVLQVAGLLQQQNGSRIERDQPWEIPNSNQGDAVIRREYSTEETAQMHRYLGSYRSVSTQQPLRAVVWPEEIFVSLDQGGHGLNGMLDMTGRQRSIIDGPWFGLPRGRWRATIEFAVADNLMGCVMQVNVFGHTVLRQGRVTLPESGRYMCDLDFQHDDARVPLVIQFTLDRGVLQGRFGLVQVKLMKVVDGRNCAMVGPPRD